MQTPRLYRKTWQLVLVVVTFVLGATVATAQFGGGFGPGRMGPHGGGNMEGVSSQRSSPENWRASIPRHDRRADR